jgi:hypothetical protein
MFLAVWIMGKLYLSIFENLNIVYMNVSILDVKTIAEQLQNV